MISSRPGARARSGGLMDDEIVTVEIPASDGEATTAVGLRSFLKGGGPDDLPALAARAVRILYGYDRGQEVAPPLPASKEQRQAAQRAAPHDLHASPPAARALLESVLGIHVAGPRELPATGMDPLARTVFPRSIPEA
jgi:hypothetical protein